MRPPGEKAPPPVPERSDAVWRWSAELRSITPIVNGGSRSKSVDEGRPIRVPSVRGQLRHWWRAIQDTTDLDELREREGELFGAVHPAPRASPVTVWVHAGTESNTTRATSQHPYALWTLVKEPTDQLHVGVEARIEVTGPIDRADELTCALEAWLWCGGIGSRTRRGYGALTADGHTFRDPGAWANEIRRLAPRSAARAWPSLADATLLHWPAQRTPDSAHRVVLDALMQSRVKSAAGRDGRAPGIDKDSAVMTAGRGSLATWPALGLPIPFAGRSPVTIKPRGDKIQRLPSPLLVRVVPLSDGFFLPALVALRLWATPNVEVSGARDVHGQVRQDGLDGFVEFLVQKKGARPVGGGR